MEETLLGKAIKSHGKISIQEIREACNAYEAKDPQLTFYELSGVVEKLSLLGFHINVRKSNGEPRSTSEICGDILKISVPFPENVCFIGTENQVKRIKNLVEFYNSVYHAQIPLYNRKGELRPIEQICDDLYLVADKVRIALESDDVRYGIKPRLRKLLELNKEYTKHIKQHMKEALEEQILVGLGKYGGGRTVEETALKETQLSLAEKMMKKARRKKSKAQKGTGPTEPEELIAQLNWFINLLMTQHDIFSKQFIWQVVLNGCHDGIKFIDPYLAEEYNKMKNVLFNFLMNKNFDEVQEFSLKVMQAIWMAALVGNEELKYFSESAICYTDAKSIIMLHNNISAMQMVQIIVACCVLSGAVEQNALNGVISYIISTHSTYDDISKKIVEIISTSTTQVESKILRNIYQRMTRVRFGYTLERIFGVDFPLTLKNEIDTGKANLFIEFFATFKYSGKEETASLLSKLANILLKEVVIQIPKMELNSIQLIIRQMECKTAFQTIAYIATRFSELCKLH